jgi:hypothetical protein
VEYCHHIPGTSSPWFSQVSRERPSPLSVQIQSTFRTMCVLMWREARCSWLFGQLSRDLTFCLEKPKGNGWCQGGQLFLGCNTVIFPLPQW